MNLDVREIAYSPGKSKGFEYELSLDGLSFDSVVRYDGPARIKGEVFNSAGVLKLRADFEVGLTCVCGLCVKEFDREMSFPVEATLAAELQDEENPDIYLIKDELIDLDDIMMTAFVFNVDERILCGQDCRGLCSRCGSDLNEGPCDCKPDVDPRLEILGKLLDKD